MRWLSKIEPRLGPFAEATRAFAAWRRPAGFDVGADGVRALLRELDAFVYDADGPQKDEERFIEGAGSLLAALLVAHLPPGRHIEREGRHALRLGRWGFFDPFAAIDAALDADSPRLCLARELQRAEAEAHGDGPFCRSVDLFEELLGMKRPDLTLLEAFASHLRLGEEIEVELSDAMRASEGDDGDLELALSRLITGSSPAAIRPTTASSGSTRARVCCPGSSATPSSQSWTVRGPAPRPSAASTAETWRASCTSPSCSPTPTGRASCAKKRSTAGACRSWKWKGRIWRTWPGAPPARASTRSTHPTG